MYATETLLRTLDSHAIWHGSSGVPRLLLEVAPRSSHKRPCAVLLEQALRERPEILDGVGFGVVRYVEHQLNVGSVAPSRDVSGAVHAAVVQDDAVSDTCHALVQRTQETEELGAVHAALMKVEELLAPDVRDRTDARDGRAGVEALDLR